MLPELINKTMDRHAAKTPATYCRVRWRNKHAKPTISFAVGSKIREPDYLPLSA